MQGDRGEAGMSEVKATAIRVEYSDGSVDHADGEVAEKIWNWLNACQAMNWIHGGRYSGPQFEHIKAMPESL